jgi:hypothetical protein
VRTRSAAAVAAAAELLARLRAEHPDDIDVELVAAFHDAHVLWLPLTNEAGHVRRIGETSYIGVAESARASKQWRFTVMHEVAHRIMHPPWAASHCADGGGSGSPEERQRYYAMEREANDFAAEVLLARSFFAALVNENPHAPVTLDEIAMIARCLDVSLSATALRYTELCGDVACAVALSQQGKIVWREMSAGFRGKIVKGRTLDPSALAGKVVEAGVDRIDGEVRGAWGKRIGTVREQSIRAGEGALTWLWHGRG